jgi:hypothetical protein
MSRSRRPMSPSSLRGQLLQLSYMYWPIHISPPDVDLTHGPEGPVRPYPAPPTGHELMALFPPAPPATLEMKPGSTSGYFRREERAFFAQGDKEIVRVRMEMDLPPGSDRKNGQDKGKSREPLANQNGGPRQYLPQMTSPPQASTYPHPNPRQSRGPPIPVPSSFQTSPHSQHDLGPPPPPPPLPPPRKSHTVSHDSAHSMTNLDFHAEEMNQDNPDEAWRRPMPYAERRRAGKHTKRVIVRT